MSGDVPAPQVLDQVLGKLLKPGSKTTEFLTLIAVYAGVLATLLGGFDTHNPQWNAILKMVALGAAAASHIGYALSRGNVKKALTTLTATLTSYRLLGHTTGNATMPANPTPDRATGVAVLALLGSVVAAVGAVLLIIAAVHARLSVVGLILLVVGAVLLYADRDVHGARRV